MGLPEGVRKALGFLKRAVAYRSLSTASLIQRNLPNIVAPTRAEDGRIAIEKLGLSLDPARHAYYLPILFAVRDLVEGGAGTFVTNEDGDPEFRAGGLRIAPSGRDDLLVLEETFAKRLYEIYDDREWFVWDVGMNVGLVALYYAGIKGWEVLAYEPFAKTFEIARRNVARNGLEGRIHMRNLGVDAKAGRMEIAYNEAARATNGLYGNLWKDRQEPDERVEIELVDAADALEEAMTMAGDRPLLAKIDCEGAEYGILDRLVERGLLDRIEAFILEYHFIQPDHTAERIRAPLLAHGYLVKTLWTNLDAGGLYAMKAKR